MALQFLINIGIAVLWMFFSNGYNTEYFAVGFFWGMIVLFIFKKFIKTKLYYVYVYKWLKLIIMFLFELLKADYNVLKLMFKKDLDINPVIFEYPLDVTKSWQITLLANMITLTPGTLTVNVSCDNKKLFIHCLDTNDVLGEIDGIKQSFEKAILEVSLDD